MSIRVLLADDQALIRAGFRMIIDAEPGMTVVDEAADGQEALNALRRGPVDLVLMDIRMPHVDGLEATRRICSDDRLTGVRVIVLTTFDSDDNVLVALQAGASGFLGKNVAPAELVNAVRVVASGEALLSPRATRSLVARVVGRNGQAVEPELSTLDSLTERERQILVLVAHGLSNVDIASRLRVAPATVKTHVNRTMTKLGARDRAQLVVIAYRNYLVRPGDPLPVP